MNKSELVERVHETFNLTFDTTEKIVDTIFGSLKDTLDQGGRIEIRGFGAFTVKEYEEYQGRNPKTGEPVTVKAKRLPAWRAGLELQR